MGAVAGTLLVVAGIALLRRTPRAATFARRVAVASLVGTIAFIPRMGVFAILLIVVFPIALLLFLHLTRGGSTPTVA